MKSIDTHVGKKLKQRRTILGMSQEAVAKSIGITFQQIQKYEKGSNAMNASRLYELACFLGVPVAYFFDELEEATQSTEPMAGFAESPAVAFDHEDKDAGNASDRESLEVMKSFNRIKDPLIRKRLADLLRAVSESKIFPDE